MHSYNKVFFFFFQLKASKEKRKMIMRLIFFNYGVPYLQIDAIKKRKERGKTLKLRKKKTLYAMSIFIYNNIKHLKLQSKQMYINNQQLAVFYPLFWGFQVSYHYSV